MRGYMLSLYVKSDNGDIPRDVCERIRDALNSLVGGVTIDDFCERDGNSLDYRYQGGIGKSRTVEGYFRKIAKAIRAVPGCEKGGEHAIKIVGGYDIPVMPEYELIENL